MWLTWGEKTGAYRIFTGNILGKCPCGGPWWKLEAHPKMILPRWVVKIEGEQKCLKIVASDALLYQWCWTHGFCYNIVGHFVIQLDWRDVPIVLKWKQNTEVTTAWHPLRLRMEETASRYGGQLRKISLGQPTRGCLPAGGLGVGLTNLHRKKNIILLRNVTEDLGRVPGMKDITKENGHEI